MSERGHVLIVDDDPSSADALQDLLEKAGYTVASVTCGDEAVQAFASREPNLVLLDANLPGVNPFALRDALNETPHRPDVPVIFMTTLEDDEARVRGLEAGDDLLVKPFDTREVLARVERQVTVSKVRMALRESEAKFRSVMESAVDAIISSDAAGIIRSWNSAATVLFGFAEDEVLNKPIEVIIPDRFRKSHGEGVRRVSTGGPSRVIGKTVEVAALRKDGGEFPVELSLATWFLDDKRYYTGIIRDISERKQAEQKFRSVTESAIDAIISADHTGEIISWNKAATRILGYTDEEAIGQRLELIVPERFHEAHRAGMQRVTAGGESRVIGRTVELGARTKGGEEVPIELSLSTWKVQEERYFTGIIRDIGERKRAEEALRESERALRAKTLELKDKNDALEKTLTQLNEMQAQLIVQEKMASLGRLSAGMAHELNNPSATVQRGASHLHEVFTRLRELEASLRGLSLTGPQQDTLTDLDQAIVNRALHPPDLKPLTRGDREAALEEWLDGIDIGSNRDLAPPLINLGYTREELEVLAQEFTAPQFASVLDWLACSCEIYSLLAEIRVGTVRITEIVRALKTYTYMDQAPIQDVDIHKSLDDTLIILHSKLKAGVTVIREYAEELPAIQAHGGELNQVWTNLIDNAVDAMNGKGTLTVRTRREDLWLVVEIEDDGQGIPEALQTKVFEPFFTTKPPGAGTGLGLNISRNLIVHKHKGQIAVSSEPGRTCLIVRLPMYLAEAAT